MQIEVHIPAAPIPAVGIVHDPASKINLMVRYDGVSWAAYGVLQGNFIAPLPECFELDPNIEAGLNSKLARARPINVYA